MGYPNVPLATLVVGSFQADGRRFDKWNSAILARSTCQSPRVWQPSISSSRIPESFFLNEITFFRVDFYGLATEREYMGLIERERNALSQVVKVLEE